MGLLRKIDEAKQKIQSITPTQPQIGLILGSGLGEFANQIEDAFEIDYRYIPHFPISTVKGHAGKLIIGKIQDKVVLAMQGRFHLYEGYSQQQVVFPVFVMHALGIKVLLVTNACGGLNPDFHPGDLMVITDHLNLTGSSPLVGQPVDELGSRFTDMSTAYHADLRNLTKKVASKLGISLQEGVYVGQTGPTYSTPAEYKVFRALGGDAIGMSTVPEMLIANYLGTSALGISCITDRATGEASQSLTHEEVIAVANRVKPQFMKLIKGVIEEIGIYKYS